MFSHYLGTFIDFEILAKLLLGKRINSFIYEALEDDGRLLKLSTFNTQRLSIQDNFFVCGTR